MSPKGVVMTIRHSALFSPPVCPVLNPGHLQSLLCTEEGFDQRPVVIVKLVNSLEWFLMDEGRF